MVHNKETKTLLIEEKDFSSYPPIIGYAIDLIRIPKELEDDWYSSDLKIAFIPMLNAGGKIEFI